MKFQNVRLWRKYNALLWLTLRQEFGKSIPEEDVNRMVTSTELALGMKYLSS